jgi:hypothetical protein
MSAQIIGAVGLTSTAAGAYYVASGHLSYVAFTLWVANWLFAANQVHFVQLRIHAGRLSTVLEKFQQGRVFLVGQLVLLAGVAALSLMGVFPKLTLLAFIPAIARGTLWFLRGQQPLDVHKLGFSELCQVIAFGALLSAAFLV